MDHTKEDPTLRDYARGVWRRKGLVVIVVVVVTALAVGYSVLKTPLYSASAQLIYESQINVADPLSTSGSADTATQSLQIASVASLIASPDLVKAANADVSSADMSNWFTVTSTPNVAAGQSVASTVSITAVSPGAKTAAAAANAYAAAFVASRKALAQERVRQAEQVIQSRIDSFGSSGHGSAEYLTLQQRLQDLQILEATVTGNFRVLIPATIPAKPFTPKPVRNGIMGVVAGLVLGVAFVLLIEQFDTRVRTIDDAVALVDMPLLARIRKMSAARASEDPLVIVSDSRSPTAESIRKLRSNLEFANVDGDLGSFFITSCLQHEGKSVTVCNLALALAASDNRVVLVDGDLRRPQVHRYLNLPNSRGLSTVLHGKGELSDALLTYYVGSSLTTPSTVRGAEPDRGGQLAVLTSGPLPPNPAEMVSSKSFARLMKQLRGQFDLVLVDAPALLAVGDAAGMARCLDGMVFLIDISRARRPLLKEAALQLSQMPCRKLGVVILSPGKNRRSDRYYYSYDAQVGDAFDPAAVGTKPQQDVQA